MKKILSILIRGTKNEQFLLNGPEPCSDDDNSDNNYSFNHNIDKIKFVEQIFAGNKQFLIDT